MLWAGLVLFYGIVKGFRDVVKKKALTNVKEWKYMLMN